MKKNGTAIIPLSVIADNTERADDRRNRSPEPEAMGKDPLAWEEIRTDHIIEDEWIDFRKTSYRFPDGSVYEPFYSYSRRDYVVIVASDPEGKFLCVRQFRQGIRQVTTEFPAGCIERKDSRGSEEKEKNRGKKKGEARGDTGKIHPFGDSWNASLADALEAAKRELREETGFESDDWKHLLTVPSNATLADNYAFLFEARNCRRISGQMLDDMEFLDIKKYSGQEIEDLIAGGEFQQAVHITAWLLAQRKG